MSKTHTAEPGMLPVRERGREREGAMRHKQCLCLCSSKSCLVSAPVWWSGEETQDDVSSLHVNNFTGGVQQVEVEVRVSGYGAVETCFQKRGPLFLKDTLRAAQVGLTNTGHAGHHDLRMEKVLFVSQRQSIKKGSKSHQREVVVCEERVLCWFGPFAGHI